MSYTPKNPLIKHEFAIRLRLLRKSRKLTQQDLSDKIGIARKTLASWESKVSSALPQDLNHLIALCEILKTTPSYLLSGIFGETREEEHERRYLDLYSRYRNNADFFLLVRTLMELDDDYIKILSNFTEELYAISSDKKK